MLAARGREVYSSSHDVMEGDDEYESEEQLFALPDGTQLRAFPGIARDGYRNLYQMRPSEASEASEPTFERIGVQEDGGAILLNRGATRWEIFFQEPGFQKTEQTVDDLFGPLQLEVFEAWCANYGPVDIHLHSSFTVLDDPLKSQGIGTSKPVVFLEDGNIVTLHGNALNDVQGKVAQWLEGRQLE